LNGPPPTNFPGAAAGPDLLPLMILWGVGFAVLLVGQLTSSNTIKIAGLAMFMVATFAVPILAFLPR
jgi:hypothetical protein